MAYTVINHMFKIILILLLLTIPLTTSASVFIRSIEYSVSPDMTLNDAKSNALKQLKIDILSEVGSLIEAEIKSQSNDYEKSQSVNYSQISAGNIKVKILNEAFDGLTLYLEIQAKVDKDHVLELLNRIYNLNNKENKITELLVKLSNSELEKQKIKNENVLLKIRLNSIKAGILFIEKVKVKSDSIKAKIIEIEKRWANIKEEIQTRDTEEWELYVTLSDLAKRIYINGMTFEEFNSIFPVVHIDTYLKENPVDNCIPSKRSKNLYFIAKYKGVANIYFLLERNKLSGSITGPAHYNYSATSIFNPCQYSLNFRNY